MPRVKVTTKLTNDKEQIDHEQAGLYQENKLIYQEDNAKITIFLQDKILIRETSEAILSYKFSLSSTSRFEIFLKSLQKTVTLELTTIQIAQTENQFEVIYQITGNNYQHHYVVKWRNI